LLQRFAVLIAVDPDADDKTGGLFFVTFFNQDSCNLAVTNEDIIGPLDPAGQITAPLDGFGGCHGCSERQAFGFHVCFCQQDRAEDALARFTEPCSAAAAAAGGLCLRQNTQPVIVGIARIFPCDIVRGAGGLKQNDVAANDTGLSLLFNIINIKNRGRHPSSFFFFTGPANATVVVNDKHVLTIAAPPGTMVRDVRNHDASGSGHNAEIYGRKAEMSKEIEGCSYYSEPDKERCCFDQRGHPPSLKATVCQAAHPTNDCTPYPASFPRTRTGAKLLQGNRM